MRFPWSTIRVSCLVASAAASGYFWRGALEDPSLVQPGVIPGTPSTLPDIDRARRLPDIRVIVPRAQTGQPAQPAGTSTDRGTGTEGSRPTKAGTPVARVVALPVSGGATAGTARPDGPSTPAPKPKPAPTPKPAPKPAPSAQAGTETEARSESRAEADSDARADSGADARSDSDTGTRARSESDPQSERDSESEQRRKRQ